LGFEVAKDVILTGTKGVSIYDPTPVTIQDIGSNFYLNESHVGKVSRAEATLGQLRELNPAMDINIAKGPITKELIANYTVVYITELLLPVSEIIGINQFCRTHTPAIGFILTLNLGLYGCTFVDFGPKFMVKDSTGENTVSYIMVHVSNANPGIVRLHEDKKHSYNDGDYVKFREVEGMVELNSTPPMPIKFIDKHSFSIGDTSAFKEYKA
jgi:ubiquitin-activating enzyme E1